MDETTSYKVSLGKIARTLVYDDPQGPIVFVFDASVSKDERTGKWTMFLDSRPIVAGKSFEPRTSVERDRVNVAVERSRRFLEGCGYIVEVTI